MTLTTKQLEAMIPNASDVRIAQYLGYINAAMKAYDINTSLRVAAFIAQITHESGSLRYTSEIASGSAYEYRKDLGNLDPRAIAAARKKGTTTGKFYKGHGLIQITGFHNHLKCGEALGLDLVNDPELLTKPEYAALSAAWWWRTHGLNELADKKMFQRITRLINGGTNGAEDRIANYARCLKVLGL
jgi:putative chitinase